MGGELGKSDMSKMWEVNSALEPPTGLPAALEGSYVHTARGLCLKICSARRKLNHGVSGGQELEKGPMGLEKQRKTVFENNVLTVQEPVTVLSSMWSGFCFWFWFWFFFNEMMENCY